MINTPSVLSSTFVIKYQRQASFDNWCESIREIVILMKWAINCEQACFDASSAHIFQARFGNYR